uniref:Uncharacterized protein n=1 Tax=viral metagenome TaxID=1070528 RepID=A0A6H1Z7M6_9ZZZZ
MAWWNRLGMGTRVDATARALGAETFEWASVVGGDVLITQIIGRLTVIVNALDNVFLQFTPDLATAGVTALCAAININGFNVGATVTITGVPGNALLPAVSAGAVPGMTTPLILPAGGVESVGSAAPGTGTMLWSLWYIPLNDAAYVVGV